MGRKKERMKKRKKEIKKQALHCCSDLTGRVIICVGVKVGVVVNVVGGERLSYLFSKVTN